MFTILPIMMIVYVILQFLFNQPSWAALITFILSILSYGPLERARYYYERRFLIRPGSHIRFGLAMYWIVWTLLQAIILSILSYFMACQCQSNPWNGFIFSSSTLLLIFIFYRLDQSTWGQSIYIFPYAYMRLAIPIGLIHALLLIYIPKIFETPSIWSKRIFEGVNHLLRFGGNAWRGDICSAYVHLDQSLSQIFLSLPFPFSDIAFLLVRTEMTYGFLVLLYAWNAYRLARWRLIKDRDEIPQV